jgi:hypothetical protein
VVDQLQQERSAQIRAIMANGGFLQAGQEGLNYRKTEIERINNHFDKAVAFIMDPGKEEREQAMLEANPLFAAGIRAMDNLRWEFEGQRQIARQLAEARA